MKIRAVNLGILICLLIMSACSDGSNITVLKSRLYAENPEVIRLRALNWLKAQKAEINEDSDSGIIHAVFPLIRPDYVDCPCDNIVSAALTSGWNEVNTKDRYFNCRADIAISRSDSGLTRVMPSMAFELFNRGKKCSCSSTNFYEPGFLNYIEMDEDQVNSFDVPSIKNVPFNIKLNGTKWRVLYYWDRTADKIGRHRLFLDNFEIWFNSDTTMALQFTDRNNGRITKVLGSYTITDNILTCQLPTVYYQFSVYNNALIGRVSNKDNSVAGRCFAKKIG